MKIELLRDYFSTWFFNKTYKSLDGETKMLVDKCASWVHKVAQQKIHQTAFGVGVLCLLVGYVAGWLIFAFNFGGW